MLAYIIFDTSDTVYHCYICVVCLRNFLSVYEYLIIPAVQCYSIYATQMYCLISCFVLKYLAMRRMGTRIVTSQTQQCHELNGAVALSAVSFQSFVHAFQSCVCSLVAAQYVVEMFSNQCHFYVYCRSSWSSGLHDQLAAKCLCKVYYV